MIIELTENSKYRSIKTKFRDAVDQGTHIADLDDGSVYKCDTRIAYNSMVWRIPVNWEYNSHIVYYEFGSDVPVIEFSLKKE